VVHRCENIQNKLHEKDPENFTRDARTAYNVSALELQKLLSEAGSKGRVFKVLYHSHPEHDAYFSEEDTRMALFDGESPIYPGTQYLVVSVYDEKVRDQTLFGWNPETKTFERNPL
jgi:proteasome lid subunit RPN8/RPN11